MAVNLLDKGNASIVWWEPHPHVLIEWGSIQSEAGGGQLVASDSGVPVDLCSCVGNILGQTKSM